MLNGETYTFQCFTFMFQCFIFKTLVQEISKLGARDFKTWCKRFETLVQEMQNEGMKLKVKP